MYVEDVVDGKRTYTHSLAHNFLNTYIEDYYDLQCLQHK